MLGAAGIENLSSEAQDEIAGTRTRPPARRHARTERSTRSTSAIRQKAASCESRTTCRAPPAGANPDRRAARGGRARRERASAPGRNAGPRSKPGARPAATIGGLAQHNDRRRVPRDQQERAAQADRCASDPIRARRTRLQVLVSALRPGCVGTWTEPRCCQDAAKNPVGAAT
jgi:hypothetical protein